MGKKKREVFSLQDIGKIADLPPDLPDVSNLDLEDLERKAQQLREESRKVANWTRNTLVFLEKASNLSREALDLAGDKIQKAEEALNRLLYNEPVSAHRRAAWKALFLFYLGKEIGSPEDAKNLFSVLISKKYLRESRSGNISVGNIFYSVPTEAAFGDPEIKSVSEAIRDLSVKVSLSQRAETITRIQEIVSEGDLSLGDFLEGKKGKIAFHVPAEKIPNGEGWRSGGFILIDSDGDKLWPLAAAGKKYFVEAVEEANELGVFLYFSSLNQEKPPYVSGLPEESRRKVTLLWYLLKRAISYLLEQEKTLGKKKEMIERATISSQEFFLESRDGICFVEYFGIWHLPTDDEAFSNVFFLIERLGGIIALQEIPVHLEGLLGHLLGEEFKEEEAFGGVKYPLKGILQAVYTQCLKEKDSNV